VPRHPAREGKSLTGGSENENAGSVPIFHV
jgi:hypothetical protein